MPFPNKSRKLSIPYIFLYNQYKARIFLDKIHKIEFLRKIKNKRVIYEDAWLLPVTQSGSPPKNKIVSLKSLRWCFSIL